MREEILAETFEEHRPRLRSVAYRMLGSVAEADDAVQDAWLRVARAGADDVENLAGWLTTIVSRQCLNVLRARAARRETPLDVHVPDPVVTTGEGWDDSGDPEAQGLLAESVGLALLVVLDSLDPAERLAFVLHDMFALPFEEIATIVDRSPAAARQLASRARRRVQGSAHAGAPDRARQRQVVEAWLAASRDGDFDALVALLDPGVVLRVDTGGAGSKYVRGAAEVAGNALAYRGGPTNVVVADINGAPGLVSMKGDRLLGVLSFTVVDGRIVELDILSDPTRLARLSP
jgi:RNA polymerase sigma factor (sigma-70 family)